MSIDFEIPAEAGDPRESPQWVHDECIPAERN